jgi:alpha-1,3/alpha-1,6-mannosyltransferase
LSTIEHRHFSFGRFPGGYDLQVKENVEYMEELRKLAHSLNLKSIVKHGGLLFPTIIEENCDHEVLFAPSIGNDDKTLLLQHALCVVYTPEREHFGIVPIEAMAMGTPVVAVNSGGPMETVLDCRTGFLVPSTSDAFAERIERIFAMSSSDYQMMSKAAEDRVRNLFSFSQFARSLNRYCMDTMGKKK